MPNYTWILTQYLGENNRRLMGKILPPIRDLDNGITVDVILEQLNTNSESFDFDYISSERDCLNISIPHPTERLRYFSIIYLDGKWKEGQNDVFNSKTKVIAEGKIRKYHMSPDK